MRRGIFLLAAAALAANPPVSPAQDPGTDGLSCSVSGNDVTLKWNFVFFAPIRGYILSRDGAAIASLDSGATGYLDRGVAAGTHTYVLTAVNFDGTVGLLASCTVTVPPGGLRCTVSGQAVHLEWDPLLIDVVVQNFTVYRNGDLIATLPGDRFYFDDTVSVGTYTYEVAAVVGTNSQFPVGSCEVEVDCFNLEASVEELTVTLSWKFPWAVTDPAAPIAIDPVYLIERDGQPLADTRETSYVDTVPAPGKYLYEIYLDLGTGGIRVFLFAACLVSVPGDGLPPPADLSCLVENLRIPPGPNTVVLTWTDPVAYDSIHVLRDDQELVKLEGTTTSYMDVLAPSGAHVYAVVAVRGDLKAGAKCEVTVPGSSPAPPRDLSCMLVPPPWVTDPAIGQDPVLALAWTNGDRYDAIFVLRDGGLLDTLDGGPAGETRTYIDKDPPPGIHSWCLIGVVFDAAGVAGGKSEPACCKADVPPGSIIPPQNLTCTVVDEEPSPDPTVPPSPFTVVLLQWENPPPGLCPVCGPGYDKVVIFRNGMVIASLEGTAVSFKDRVLGGGTFAYNVCGIYQDARGCSSCTVELPPGDVLPPQDFTCSLNDLIMKAGDPDLDANGLPAPTPGEVAPFLAVVLKWWNPMRYAALVVSRDKALIARLPGDAMVYRDIAPPAGLHVYGISGVLADGQTSPVVTCEITVGEGVPPVQDLVCGVEEKAVPDTVDLAWVNGAAYEAIFIARNGEPLAKLPGDFTSYKDAGLKPGIYIYEVVGVTADGRSPPANCMAVIEGPPSSKVLYFSGGLMNQDPAAGVPVLAAIGNRITCLASTDEEVQGWSFGVQSDPKFIVAAKYDLDDTVTKGFNGGAGPAFLSVKLLPEGVVMAVVIEDGSSPPAETLPPGTGHKLLNIEYASGPSGAEGEAYPVRYSNALGSPPVQVLLVVKGFEVRPSTLPGWVSIPLQKFLRGDADGNGSLDINDPVKVLGWLFLGGDEPGCMEAADTNGTRDVNIADPVYLLSYLYTGGSPPPAPFPECGSALSPLGCMSSGSCK